MHVFPLIIETFLALLYVILWHGDDYNSTEDIFKGLPPVYGSQVSSKAIATGSVCVRQQEIACDIVSMSETL